MGVAKADLISDLFSSLENTAGTLPPVDLTGWFLTFDPSNQWTSEANIETMQAWLVIAEQLAAYPGLLQQFYEFETTNSQQPSNGQPLIADPETQAPDQDFAGEPGTLGLLGGALAISALYVLARMRRINNHSAYVSLRRTDQSLDHRLHIEE